MSLADGDLYVDGSFLSFQQMIRHYLNFRAATIASNLQPGAFFSRSTDERLSIKTAADEYLVFLGDPVCADNEVVCADNSVVVTLPV